MFSPHAESYKVRPRYWSTRWQFSYNLLLPVMNIGISSPELVPRAYQDGYFEITMNFTSFCGEIAPLKVRDTMARDNSLLVREMRGCWNDISLV